MSSVAEPRVTEGKTEARRPKKRLRRHEHSSEDDSDGSSTHSDGLAQGRREKHQGISRRSPSNIGGKRKRHSSEELDLNLEVARGPMTQRVLPADIHRKTSYSSSEVALSDGTYHIINMSTEGYAALLESHEGIDVVTISMGLHSDVNQGYEWSISRHGSTYKIQNVKFESFASNDSRPNVKDKVLGKWEPKQWIIRLVQRPNIYSLSPIDNRDIFWMSTSEEHGTSVGFGRFYKSPQCCWMFKAVEQTASTSIEQPSLSIRSLDVNTLLKDLPNVPSARYCADPRERCLKGTRVDLLESIYKWVTDIRERRIFWLQGQAGTGKTTISLTVADECGRRNQLGASFMFSRDQAERNELRHVFPTIAHQLGQFHEPYKVLLADILAKDPTIATSEPCFQLGWLIVDPVERCTTFPSPVIVIIDALDECQDSNPISTLLDALRQHLGRLSKLKFFITSRPAPKIVKAFVGELQREVTHIALHEVDPLTVDADIELFARASLRKGARFYDELIEADWPSQDDVRELVRKSDRLFIYVATIIAVVFDEELEEPKLRLKEILGLSATATNTPGILDHLYLSILQAAYPDQARPHLTELLRKVLGTVLALANPLSTSELESLLGLERGKVRTVLRRLHSVLVVPDTGSSPIRIIHPSFFDFLTTCVDPRFRIDVPSHHAELSIYCFERMRKGLTRDICQIKEPWKLNEEIDDLGDRIERFIPRDLQYACRYWAIHLAKSAENEGLLDRMAEFLTCHLLHWIEVLSILGLVQEGVDQLRGLRSFLAVRFLGEQRNILGLILESDWFISTFYAVISSSALHIYISALGLLPPTSLLKQTYVGQTQNSLRLVRGDLIDPRLRRLSSETCNSLTFSPNGAYIASLGANIVICDTATAMSTTTFRLALDQVVWIQFLPDNVRVACGTVDHSVTILKVNDQRSIENFPLSPRPSSQCYPLYAADAQFDILGTLVGDGVVRLWNTITWQLQQKYTIHEPAPPTSPKGYWKPAISFEISGVSSSSQHAHVAAILIDFNGVSCIHVLHSDSIQGRLLNLDFENPTCVAFSSDGQLLAIGSMASVFVWDIRAGQRAQTWPGNFLYPRSIGPPISLAFTSDGTNLLCSCQKGISLWSADGSSRSVLGGWNSVHRIVCSPRGQMAFACDRGAFLMDANLESAMVHKTRTSSDISRQQAIGLTPDGTYLFGFHDSSYRSLACCLNTDTGAIWEPRVDPCGFVRCLVPSPDSRYIAFGSSKNNVLLYEIGTTFDPSDFHHSDRVDLVGFSHDSSMIISATLKDFIPNRLCIWNVFSRELLYLSTTGKPLGFSFPSPRWNINVSCHTVEFVAVLWGFRWVDIRRGPLAEHTPALLYRKSTDTPVVCTAAPCGATFYRVNSDTEPSVIDDPTNLRLPRHLSVAYPHKSPLHYHLLFEWIMVCDGAEARRSFWLPPEWRDIESLAASNGRIILRLQSGTCVVLDVRAIS